MCACMVDSEHTHTHTRALIHKKHTHTIPSRCPYYQLLESHLRRAVALASPYQPQSLPTNTESPLPTPPPTCLICEAPQSWASCSCPLLCLLCGRGLFVRRGEALTSNRLLCFKTPQFELFLEHRFFNLPLLLGATMR